MRRGWGRRRRYHRAATALVALTLLPVAVLVASAHPTPLVGVPRAAPLNLRVSDFDLSSVDALQRSEASNLFAPFAWDGEAATGPFVSFGFSTATGKISGYSSVDRSNVSVLVQSIAVQGFSGDVAPQLVGPTFRVDGPGVTIVAHQEPMGLLEIETATGPRSVVFTFSAGTTALSLAHSVTYPHSTLTFALADGVGSIILWKGMMSLNGTTVTAVLGSGDYLALRAVPSSVADRAERTAILAAFASGRLAAEYDLVAKTNGGWLENVAQYQPNVTVTSDGVDFNAAALTMDGVPARDGLLLLAFDPQTMPSDAGHRLVVVSNGVSIPQAQSALTSLHAPVGSGGQASFSLLAMNATVLVVYLPSLAASSIQIQSIALPVSGIDLPTELAMVAAVLVVSIAAAEMFRPRRR